MSARTFELHDKHPPGGATRPPLYVDMDETLVRTDVLAEQCFDCLARPRLLARIPGWLASGKAVLKAELAARRPVDVATLPYNQTLLDYLAGEKAQGRRLILATAADRRVAEAVAAHLGLFDDVLASDGCHNLSRERKLEAIRAQMGDAPFAYAGNGADDIVIWRAAAAAVTVNASSRTVAEAGRLTRIEVGIDDRSALLAAMVKAMRPHQWSKNVLAFVPILTAGAFGDFGAWRHAVLLFLAFCATASAIYIFNDLTDIGADRAHPRKRKRPFASGALSVFAGLAMAFVLAGTGLGLSVAAGAVGLVALYATVSLAYSLLLKELPLVDVFCLAGLYSIRLFSGGVVTGYPVSLWLLGFAGFLFLSLAMVKRSAELHDLANHSGKAGPARRGYGGADLGMLKIMGVAGSFNSVLVLALYVQSDTASARYATPELLWWWIPLLLFWQCRLWLSTERGYMHDDPIVYSSRDWVSWLVGLGLVVMLVLAHGTWVGH